MNKIKSQKGITLIALIITIVVLLILAVVAIRAVQGDGIIAKAKEAKTKYEEAQALEESMLSDFEIELAKSSPTSFDSNTMTGTSFTKTTFLKDAKGKTFVVPAGYTIVKDDSTEQTVEVDKGVVITDGTNEFVWVPVTTKIQAYGLGTTGNREPDVVTGVDQSTADSASGNEYDAVPANLTRAGCTQDLNNDKAVNAYDFKIQLTNEFNEMATSVNKYDGFYVGRYEMSMNGATAQSKSGETSLGNSSSENDWYGLYAKAKTYTNPANSVVSRMIYGSQYDAMMTWMGSAANTTIGDNRNTDRTTGTCDTDVINNVYDLYGNSFEWTQEANNVYYRVYRGGNYQYSRSPSDRDPDNPEFVDDWGYRGSRLSLYIK